MSSVRPDFGFDVGFDVAPYEHRNSLHQMGRGCHKTQLSKKVEIHDAWLNGLTVDQIADETGIPVGTVQSILTHRCGVSIDACMSADDRAIKALWSPVFMATDDQIAEILGRDRSYIASRRRRLGLRGRSLRGNSHG